ncbi:YqgE/AlgH family protein [Gordonia sp. (in: high G+C Gram-positive bacteria)]|uniref:YqgE/AlgH family protein n=1 Tax=Gordonia sp. (in: high G+C Gram-positive bacteria) TaxID=84139 RepID=UPI0016983BA2|nr:YqgE/AlgH family protein [Gordonia sp. (in: high G+C Gram-positive bacteria)]NLG47621.1 YqgE/AlgH family protein [Gordonia sp. (in: high G+C Gram-positive bacteria)]
MSGSDYLTNQPEVTAGSLLIASTGLTGPTFARTVIYVIEHDAQGTLGVVLNRMSDAAVFNVLPAWAELAARPRAVFVGGPVGTSSALCLGVAKTGVDVGAQPKLHQVLGPVAMVDLDADPEDLAQILTGVRIFAGYAGWDAGQLDEEISEGSWIVTQSLPTDLLSEPSVDIWQHVLRRQPWPLPLLSTFPLRPEEN